MSGPQLGGARRPGSPPRPEVLAAVVRRGRQRIRRAATVAAGVTAVVAGGVLSIGAFGTAGSGALVLIPANPVPGVSRAPAPSPDPTPAALPTSGPAGPSTAPEPGVRPAPGPSATAQTPSEPEVPAVVRPAPVDTDSRKVRPYRETPEPGAYAEVCTGSPVGNAPQGYRLCATGRSSAGLTIASGSRTTLSFQLCNSLSSSYGYLMSFATGREHDVLVRKVDAADEYLWTWSRAYTFPEGAHSRSLAAGECLTWKTLWDTRDDEGRLLPPDRYTVSPTVDLEGRTHRMNMQITITPPA